MGRGAELMKITRRSALLAALAAPLLKLLPKADVPAPDACSSHAINTAHGVTLRPGEYRYIYTFSRGQGDAKSV